MAHQDSLESPESQASQDSPTACQDSQEQTASLEHPDSLDHQDPTAHLGLMVNQDSLESQEHPHLMAHQDSLESPESQASQDSPTACQDSQEQTASLEHLEYLRLHLIVGCLTKMYAAPITSASLLDSHASMTRASSAGRMAPWLVTQPQPVKMASRLWLLVKFPSALSHPPRTPPSLLPQLSHSLPLHHLARLRVANPRV